MVSGICGPGAPLCAVVTVLAGGLIGGIVGEAAADLLNEEIEEFIKWDIS